MFSQSSEANGCLFASYPFKCVFFIFLQFWVLLSVAQICLHKCWVLFKMVLSSSNNFSYPRALYTVFIHLVCVINLFIIDFISIKIIIKFVLYRILKRLRLVFKQLVEWFINDCIQSFIIYFYYEILIKKFLILN